MLGLAARQRALVALVFGGDLAKYAPKLRLFRVTEVWARNKFATYHGRAPTLVEKEKLKLKLNSSCTVKKIKIRKQTNL